MSECDEIEECILDGLETNLAPARRARMAAHLDRCPRCAQEASLVRELLGGVERLPVPEPPPDFWRGFEESVRRRVAQEPLPRPPALGWLADWLRRFGGPQAVPVLATAAALALFLAIGLLHTPRPARELAMGEVPGSAEELQIAQNLDVLEHFDLLENLDVLEQLPLLGPPAAGSSPQMG